MPRPKTLTSPVTIWLPDAWLDDADAIGDAYEKAFKRRPPRTEVLRMMIEIGLRTVREEGYTFSLDRTSGKG